MARPSKLTEEAMQRAREYIVNCVDSIEKDNNGRIVNIEVNLPKAEGLAKAIGVRRETLYDWADKESPRYNEEFSNILCEVNEMQVERLIDRGLAGHYNATIAKLVLAKHGYKDSLDYTSDNKPIKNVNITIIDGSQSQCEQDIQEECAE
jgi:DNA-binding XRE family transcriptional regulator